jgi:hypothetical protein
MSKKVVTPDEAIAYEDFEPRMPAEWKKREEEVDKMDEALKDLVKSRKKAEPKVD